MGRVDSPLKGRMIFAFGARRSGTYWLDRIISAHPRVSTVPSETHLFYGIAQLLERFHHGGRDSPKTGAVYADRGTLIDAVRDLCDRVFGEFRSDAGSFVLERTALHAEHAELIGEVYPDGHLVHIIRDPHEVVRSLLAQPWGPTTAEQAAREWRTSVVASRSASRHPGYVEIRYENLRQQPGTEVRALYASLGLPSDAAILRAAVEAAGIRVNVAPSSPGPGMGSRKRELSDAELRAIGEVAGDLAEDLGYARPAPARTARRRRLVTAIKPIRGRLRRAAAPEPNPQSQQSNPDSVLWLLDRLVSCASQRRPERALDLLAPELSLRVGDGSVSVEHRGAEARERLIELLATDVVFRWRQTGTDILPGNPTAGYVLTYQDRDGTVAERLLMITATGDRLARVVLFQLPPTRRDPSGG